MAPCDMGSSAVYAYARSSRICIGTPAQSCIGGAIREGASVEVPTSNRATWPKTHADVVKSRHSLSPTWSASFAKKKRIDARWRQCSVSWHCGSAESRKAGQRQRGLARLQASLRASQDRQMPLEVGLARYALGQMLGPQDSAGHTHLEQALTIFRAAGVPWYTQRIERLLRPPLADK